MERKTPLVQIQTRNYSGLEVQMQNVLQRKYGIDW